jgi:hypothetical protein
MALTQQDILVIAQVVTQLLNERSAPIGTAAHVVPGSYREGDGTVEASVDNADAAYQLAAALGDEDTTQWLAHVRVPLVVTDPNDQYGPRGGEPLLLHPTERGRCAQFVADAVAGEAVGAGPYYTVKAPAGERHILHRNADGAIDSGVQLTNDGPTSGDGLGGTLLGNKGALTAAQTESGHEVSLNDTTQQIKVATAGGALGANPLIAIFDDVEQTITHAVSPTLLSKLDLPNGLATTQVSSAVKTIWDSAGNAISHVVPGGSGGVVALGDLAANLTSGSKGAINNDILTTFGSNINNFGLANLISYAQLLKTVGAITSAQLTAMLAQLVLSWVTNVVVPAGSAIVKIAS